MIRIGAAPRSATMAMLDSWPIADYVVTLLLKILPLPLRAVQLTDSPTIDDAAVLLLWIVVGVLGNGLTTLGTLRFRGLRGGAG